MRGVLRGLALVGLRVARDARGDALLDARLLVEAALDHEIVPGVEDRHLVERLVLRAEAVELRAVPVGLPLLLGVERRHLEQLVRVVAVAMQRVPRGAVALGDRDDLLERLLQLVAAEDRGVPGDVDDSCHGPSPPPRKWLRGPRRSCPGPPSRRRRGWRSCPRACCPSSAGGPPRRHRTPGYATAPVGWRPTRSARWPSGTRTRWRSASR